MKKLLVVGDSFFRSDPERLPGRHFSEMFGDDIEVTNSAVPGGTNFSVVGHLLCELEHNSYDYVVLGFTDPGRIPTYGETNGTIPICTFKWHSTSHYAEPKEREIIDNFLSLVQVDEMEFAGLCAIYTALTTLDTHYKDIKFAWAAGAMYHVLRIHDMTHDPRTLIARTIREKYQDRQLSLNYWQHQPFDPNCAWHINDVVYQRAIANKFKKLLGIES